MRASSWVATCGLLAAIGCSGGGKTPDPAQDVDPGKGVDPDDFVEPYDGGQPGDGAAPGDAGKPSDGNKPDAGPVCKLAPVFDTVSQGNERVDLLFVVDNSGSMKEEQQNLAAQLPKLVRILATGRLEDASGNLIRRFPPVKSLHLGVTSSDMGINGLPPDVQAIVDCPGPGDDGLLLNTGSVEPDCAGKTFANKYLQFQAGVDDATALGRDFSCITSLGTHGCGFEQQLEAMWKALAPSQNSSFSAATPGHGDTENAGFLRPDSVLAVIHVSDEEDCSIPDSSRDLFNPTPTARNGLNVACIRNPGLQHPASRYIEGLKSLRPGSDQVIFAAIVGIPQEAEGLAKGDAQDFDGILARDDMQYGELPPDANGMTFPRLSCESANGKAFAPRRFVEVAKGFGKNGLVRSICQDDFSSALGGLIDKIADQLDRTVGTCTLDAECPDGWLCARPGSENAGLCLNPECVQLL